MKQTVLIPAGDRSQLVRLLQARGRVTKNQIKATQAVQMAAFEKEMATIYDKYDQHWDDLTKDAEKSVAKLDEALQKRCSDLGIPKEFRPSLHADWWGRGENMIKERRQELRAVAKTAIEARAKVALAEVDRSVADTMGEILTSLSSEAGRAALANMPTVEQLMPQLTVKEAEAERLPLAERGRRRRRW